MTRVLVTGASGFIGRALCDALRDHGLDVAAAVRDPRAVPFLEGVDVLHVADIGPETDWDAVLEGVATVVHVAAHAHVMNERSTDAAEFRRVNALGTRRLAEAAASGGVGRLVFVSTTKVMGEASKGAPFREADPPAPEDAYAVSKWEAEQGLAEVAAQTGLETVVLRPPLVYGPEVRGNFLTLLTACRWALPLPLASLSNRRSIIYVGNLVSAVVACATRPEAAGEIYFVRDGEDLSTPDIFRRVAAALGRPSRLFPFPVSVLRLGGRVTGKSTTVSRLLDTFVVDDRKIRTHFDWTPPHTVAEGLAETAAWFTSRGETQVAIGNTGTGTSKDGA